MNTIEAKTRGRPVALLIATLLLGACSDSLLEPADASREERTSASAALSALSVLEGPFNANALITCNVTVASAVVSCTSPQDPNPAVAPTVGGFGVHARLVPSNAVHVPDSARFRMSMQIRNLLVNRIGAKDGPITGMKAFFHQLPVTTSGSGSVTVENPFGVDEFTAPNQPYFNYPFRLRTLETSQPRNWRFTVPPTVNAFRFRIYVSAYILPMVVFDMEKNGNRDIWRINIDGTDSKRLTSNKAVDMQPTVARNNVVFVSYRSGNAELYSVPLEGGSQLRLTDTPWAEYEPALVPNNQKLAFVSDQGSMPRIWHSSVSATGAQPLVTQGHGGVIHASPTWLSTTQLVFSSPIEDVGGIYRANLSGNVFVEYVTAFVGSAKLEPKFNHAQSLLAFVREVPASNAELYLYDVGAGTTTRLTDRNLPDIQPTFLHDDRLAYIRIGGGGARSLRLRTLDGLSDTEIPVNGQPRNPFGVPLWQ